MGYRPQLGESGRLTKTPEGRSGALSGTEPRRAAQALSIAQRNDRLGSSFPGTVFPQLLTTRCVATNGSYGPSTGLRSKSILEFSHLSWDTDGAFELHAIPTLLWLFRSPEAINVRGSRGLSTEEANRNIAEAEQRIADQKAQITELERTGQSTDDSLEVLRQLEQSLAQLIECRENILSELKQVR